MENNEVREALNCPCCGGDIQYCITGNIVQQDHWFFIQCFDCRLKTGNFKTREESIKAWNKRASTNNELVRALEFYADEKNWESVVTLDSCGCCTTERNAIKSDRGNKAKQALFNAGTPTIGSDNTQTVYNLLAEHDTMLEDIRMLREGLLLVNKESTNFRLKAPTYMVDRIDNILMKTAKYEKEQTND